MKPTDYTTVNEIVLTTPQINLLKKVEALGVIIDATVTSALNPVTGVTLENLHPLVARLCRLIYQLYATYDRSGTMSYNGHPVSIQTFDRIKYLVLDVDNKAYSELID